MNISKELRTLGQHSAALSASAIALASFHNEVGAEGAMPFLTFAGTKNAAILAGIAGILVTGYFCIRALDERLASNIKLSMAAHDASQAPSETLTEKIGEELGRNALLQTIVKGSIGFIDLWLPIVLALIVAFSMWPAMIVFFAELSLKLS